MTGTSGADVLDALAGNDRLSGLAGNDTLRGGDGNDHFSMDTGDDIIEGGAGVDTITADGTTSLVLDLLTNYRQHTGYGFDLVTGVENVTGSSGSDHISATYGSNVILGRGGDDIIRARGGSDTVTGGAGRDEMFAGADTDRDVFVFTSVNDSGKGTKADIIREFNRGIDDIDLSAIDANGSASGNQAFGFSGTTAGAYSVWTAVVDGVQVVRADVTGDRTADMEIRVDGTAALTMSDFIL